MDKQERSGARANETSCRTRKDIVEVLLQALKANQEDLARHRNFLFGLWALGESLPENIREMTYQTHNANCGPFDRSTKNVIDRAEQFLEGYKLSSETDLSETVIAEWLAPTYDIREEMEWRLVKTKEGHLEFQFFDCDDEEWVICGDCSPYVAHGFHLAVRSPGKVEPKR